MFLLVCTYTVCSKKMWPTELKQQSLHGSLEAVKHTRCILLLTYSGCFVYQLNL
uniref:Uncharacterized protein n=1 Tax=Arundo donax TaxID=35708 RepID=A0A0A9FBQ2_ARUDO